MSDVATDKRDRLYGLPGAEELHFDPAEVVEERLIDAEDDQPLDFIIEEWSVHSPRYHLPNVDRLLYWIAETTDEDGEVGEGFELDDGAPEVTAAAEALLETIAATIRWRMADQKLREMHVTGTPDAPLIDGEPVWHRTPVLPISSTIATDATKEHG